MERPHGIINGICMDFSGSYRNQNFWKKDNLIYLDASAVSGTNCYCDDFAYRTLSEIIEEYSVYGIHFLDSGNYHYMTRLWIEKCETPFHLVVFDNHTDMQPPMFGGILSCGGWIAAALEEVPMLQKVLLIGPDEEAYQTVDSEIKKRVTLISREMLCTMRTPEIMEIIADSILDLPIYISVDKDVLSVQEFTANWSQGDLSTDDLMLYLEFIKRRAQDVHQKMIGMDVCGETDSENSDQIKKSDRVNQRLLSFWRDAERFQK